MARIRMIKPEFFDDPDLADVSRDARLFFIGLWTQADREGRLEYDVRRLKVRIFPFDNIDVERLTVELHGKDMIRRYKDGQGRSYIWIVNFVKHQRPHPKEPASLIPALEACLNINTGKEHGEPCKETVSPAESGSLDLRNLESETRTPPRATDDGPGPCGSPFPQGIAPPRKRADRIGDEAIAHRGHYDAPEACARGLCIPRFLGSEWLAQMGGDDPAAARDAVAEFIGWTLSQLEPGPVADDPLKFWRGAWGVFHKPQRPARVPRCDGGHTPACRTVSECIAKTIADGRREALDSAPELR